MSAAPDGIPEGMPCWADAMLPDVEAGKRFYGELFGWTFEDSGGEYGHYTQAFHDGKNVAALAPQARRPDADHLVRLLRLLRRGRDGPAGSMPRAARWSWARCPSARTARC
ncbi:hypothetical protein GCM10020000_46470 [Streptomyces olivoverticillatus]